MNNSYEYEPTMKKLVKLVIRAFYEKHHIVIMDILLEHLILTDEQFCGQMKMLSREFNKLIMRLKEDRLLKHDSMLETASDGKQLHKTVYYINFAELRDIIKYKIFRMRKLVDKRVLAIDDCFKCPGCLKTFSSLEAQANVVDYKFFCYVCDSELEENKLNEDEKNIDSKELISALDMVIGLLKKADEFTIPSLDYFQLLEIKKERLAKLEAEKEEIKKEEKKKDFETEDDGGFDEVDLEEDIKSDNEIKIDEFVTVGGVKKAFSDITKDDKDNMTDEEYIKYYEIHSKYLNE